MPSGRWRADWGRVGPALSSVCERERHGGPVAAALQPAPPGAASPLGVSPGIGARDVRARVRHAAPCGHCYGRSRPLGTRTVWLAGEVRAVVVVRLSRRVSCPVPPWSSRRASAMARHTAVTPTKAAPTAFPASSVTPHGSWCSWRSAKAAVWGMVTAGASRGCQAGISSLRRLPGKRWIRMESKFPGWSPRPVSMASVQACGCRNSCHLTRPGHICGAGRRAGPGAGPGHSRPGRAEARARRAGSGKASGAGDGRYSDRRNRSGPAAGAARR